MSDRTSQSELADKLTEYVINAVDTARQRAVDPLLMVARVLVYGLLASMVAISAGITLSILLVRILHVYLGNIPGVTQDVWLAHLVVGLLFLIVGMFLWRLRRNPTDALDTTTNPH